MNISLQQISPSLTKIRKFIARNGLFMYILVMLVAHSFLVVRINLLNRSEPTDDAVSEKLQSVQRPKIEPALLQKIQDLQDQSVEVQSLFKQARDNPFSE